MRKFLWLFLLLVFLPNSANGQTQIQSGPTNPATCNPNVGQLFFNNSVIPGTMYFCVAVNTWAPFGGGGTPGGADTDIQSNDSGAFYGDANFTRNKTTGAFLLKTPASTSTADADFTFAGSAGSGSNSTVTDITADTDTPWFLRIYEKAGGPVNTGIVIFSVASGVSYLGMDGTNGDSGLNFQPTVGGYHNRSLLVDAAGDIIMQPNFSTTGGDVVPDPTAAVNLGTAAHYWLNVASRTHTFIGSSTGSATVTAQATAGTPTLTLPTASGTFAVNATSPLALDAATGNLTCPTCTTSSAGLAFPETVSGTVTSGGVPFFNSTTQMSTSALLTSNSPVLGGGAGVAPSTKTFLTTDGAAQLTVGIAGGGNGVLALAGTTSGTATFTAPAIAGTTTNNVVSSNNIGAPFFNPTGAVVGTLAGIGQTSTSLVLNSPAAKATFFSVNAATVLSVGTNSVLLGSGGVFGLSSNANPAAAVADTGMSRDAAGVTDIGNGTAGDTTGRVKAAGYMSVGTKFTSNAGCTEGTLVGGATAGKFTVGQATACTIVITMGNTATAPNGWACWANDQTAVPAVAIRQTASNATTASLLMTVATNDVVSFGCIGY